MTRRGADALKATRADRGRVGAHGPAAVRRFRCPVVVGRERHQALLADAVDAARAGMGSAVVVVADAGIGKSRLARWAGDALTGGRRLVGRAAAPPSSNLRALSEVTLGALNAGVDPADPELQLYRSALRVLLPGVLGDGTAPVQTAGLVLGHALIEVVDRVPWEAPQLVVLEDLHWADGETLMALDHLVDMLADRSIVLLVTARPGVSSMLDELVSRWGARRAAQLVTLERLTGPQLEAMAAECFAADVPAGLLSHVTPIADGSPLLLEELLDALFDASQLRLDGDSWRFEAPGRVQIPQTVAAAVRRQVTHLDAADQAALRSAAMVGRAVDVDLLARMGYAPADIDRAITAGLSSRLLTTDSEFGDATVFRHALTQEALVTAMLPHERRATALAGLDALEDAGLGPDDLDVAATLAEYAGDTGRHIAYLVRGAEHAAAVGNPMVALTRLNSAAALARHDHAQTRAIDIIRLEALSQRGDVVAARRLLHRLLPELRSTGDVRALQRCQVALARAEGASGTWERARAAMPDLDTDPVAAEVLSFGAVVAMETGAVSDASTLAERARAAASQEGSGIAECEALEVLGRVARVDSYDAAAAVFADAVRAAERHGLRLWRARALLELGLCDATRYMDGATFEQAREAAVDAGALAFSAMVDYNLAHLYSADFYSDQALEVGQRGLETAQRLGTVTWEARLQLMIGHAHAGAGRRGEARAAGAAARVIAPDDLEVAALDVGTCQAVASLVAEDRAAAVAEFSGCLDLLQSLPFRSATMPWYDLPIVGALADPNGLGRRAVAAADAPEIRSAIGDWIPLAHAVLAGRQGEHARATRMVEDVLATARAMRSGPRWGRVDLWMRLVAEAALIDGWGDPVAWLHEAEAGLRGRGLSTVADACRALLRESGARRRTRPTDDVPAPLAALGVTQREVDVLALLTSRATNRQIADRLFISPRTVKSHIEHVLAKTGRADRHELADLARTAGLTDDRPTS